jgi:hypothetical protein
VFAGALESAASATAVAKDFLLADFGIPGLKRVTAGGLSVARAAAGGRAGLRQEQQGDGGGEYRRSSNRATHIRIAVRKLGSKTSVESRPLTPEHSGVLISNSNRAIARTCDKEVILSQLRRQELFISGSQGLQHILESSYF